MPDIQSWYLGQIVTEGEMDTIYTDLTNAERNLASEAQLGQDEAATAHKYGGILSGLEVTFVSTTSVSVSAGAARDSDGRRISLPTAATILLTNLGDTEEGVTTDATGDGSIISASITSGEAWLSLFIAFDVNLSDARIDSLDNVINFRQSESFHFELLLGTDSTPPATSRANLAETRVLLADILLDNSGVIRTISGTNAICTSSYDFNKIGYGLDDAANLYGRRSDWLAIDPDGTNYELLRTAYDSAEPNNHSYYNIRAGSPREAMDQMINLYSTPGSASKAGGSEIIGGRPVTGKTLSSPGAAAALQMPSGSVHDQLEALYDKVNTLLSRGSDTITGDLAITGDLDVSGDFQVLSGGSFYCDPNALFGGNLEVGNELKVDAGGFFNCDATADFADDVVFNGQLTIGDTGILIIGETTSWLSADGTLPYMQIINAGLIIQPDADGAPDARALIVKPHSLAAGDLPSHRQMALLNANSDEIKRWAMWGYMAGSSRHFNDFMAESITPDLEETASGGGTAVYSTAGIPHGGVITLDSGPGVGDYVKIRGPGCFIMDVSSTPHRRVICMRARFRLLDLSLANLLIGLQPNGITDPRSSGAAVVLEYAPGDPNWYFSSTLSGGTTGSSYINTGIAATAGSSFNEVGWMDMIFRADIDNNTVSCWLTGMTAVQTMQYNDYTNAAWDDAAFAPFIMCATPSGGSKTAEIDFWEVWDEEIKASGEAG